MKNYKSVKRRMPHETIYLLNTLEDIAVKSMPGNTNTYFAKVRGGKEYSVDNMSYLIWDTVSEANEITHHEYNNF